MKISLRKANALQQEIQNALKNINLSSLAVVRLNEHEDANVQIDTARSNFKDAEVLKSDLTNILYRIRKDVSRSNHKAGVSDLLTEIALIEAHLKDAKDAITAGEQMSAELIAGKIWKIKNNESSSSYDRMSSNFSTSVLSKSYLSNTEKEIAMYKRTRQNLKDKLLELNIKTEIDLSPSVEASLSKSNLI